MQQEQAPDTPAQPSVVQPQVNPAPTSISTPTDRQSQIIFEDLIHEFEKIEAIADPIEKQYVLESFLKKSDLSREAYIKLFELYQKEKKTNQWLSHWYLAPFARSEQLLEWLAARLNEMDIFKIVQQIGNIAIAFTVASLIWSVIPNSDKEIEEAWKVVESKDVGRRTRYAAIEKLHRYNQPLNYLNLPTGAYLPEINLAEADLRNSVLQEAILSGANLQGARLSDANLQGAELSDADLQGARLWGANLQKAELWRANLQKAELWRANLQGAMLGGANLQGARLWRADLQGARPERANLQGAEYTDKNTKPDVCRKYSLEHPCSTIFPENFDPKAAGMVLLPRRLPPGIE